VSVEAALVMLDTADCSAASGCGAVIDHLPASFFLRTTGSLPLLRSSRPTMLSSLSPRIFTVGSTSGFLVVSAGSCFPA
jgi:hypothetical protein